MKIGISQWAFPGDWKINKCFNLAKKAGFDGVELCIAEHGEVSLNMSLQRVKEIKKLADSEGVGLSSLCTGLLWQYPLTSSSKNISEKGKKIVCNMLETAAGLNIDTVLVVPGAVNVQWDQNSEILPYDVVLKNAEAAIKELSKTAERYKVCIGIENVWNKFLLSPLEMKLFIDRIGSEFVGAYFDVGNVLISGYPEHWIRILDRRIKRVHFKDFKLGVGNINGFVKLLEGDVNWNEVRKALKDIKYDGWVVGELFCQRICPERLIYETADAMKCIISL